MAYSALNAYQRGGIAPGGKPSFTIEQAAVQLTREGLSWSGTLGTSASVTYAFRATAPATIPGDAGGFQQVVFQQYTYIEQALQVWSKVANITFVRVGSGFNPSPDAYSDNATILIGNYTTGADGTTAFAVLPGNRDAASATGDIWFNGNVTDNRYMGGPGSNGFLTALHEIGHAIGLSHPSDYDAYGADEQDDLTYTANARYHEDSLEYSIMSYFDLQDTGGSIARTNYYPTTPLIDDIAAVQRLYGANLSTNAGNTLYAISPVSSITTNATWENLSASSGPVWRTIWDGGGVDTIDFSTSSSASRIDLRPGSFSDVQGGVGTLSIALGAIIENAAGGRADDVLIGNDVANILAGNAGNDTLTGGVGDDTLIGGDGTNTVVIAAGSSAASFSVAADGDVIVASADGRDTMRSIETVRFTDRTIATAGLTGTDAVYRSFAGRAAGSDELRFWSDRIAAGGSVADVRAAVLDDPAGRAFTQQSVSVLYQTYLGRVASGTEQDFWTGRLRAGADYGAIRSALVNDPAGQAIAAGTITGFYRDYLGRTPSSAETGFWTERVVAGKSYATIRGTIAADWSGYSFQSGLVDGLYRDHMNRGANVVERSYWVDQIRTGAEIAQIRATLVADPSAIPAVNSVIQSAYASVFTRTPSDGEYQFWQAQARQGTALATIREAIVHDPAAVANVRQSIAGYYRDYLGRSASADEVAFWSGRFYDPDGGMAGLLSVRYQIIHSDAGVAHTPAAIASLYQTYMGRAPTAGETAYWSAQLASTADLAGVRAALVNDPAGVAHTGAAVNDIYRTYLGRAASVSETAFWDAQVRGGSDFATVRGAILDDPAGRAHTAATLGALYQEYMGRGANTAEVATWDGLLHRGITFDTVVDTLLNDAGSDATGVRRFSGTAAADTIPIGASAGHAVVSGFDPAADTIDLRGSGHAGDPLAYARQVFALDGTPDVLIAYDADHSLLLRNTLLTQLTGADFLI